MKVSVLRHVPHEHLGTIEKLLIQSGIEHEYLDRYTDNPDIIKPYGLVVLGGPMGVYETDRYPFLDVHLQIIQNCIEAGIPIIGVCLGAQLIAKALGADVYQNGIKEIGWYPLELTEEGEDDSLLGRMSRSETVFQWHGDTFDLPSGAVLLASSELCANQAIKFGHNVYALQFHIEITTEMIERWLQVPENVEEISHLDYIEPQLIREQTPQHIERANHLAENVFVEFCSLIKGTLFK